MRVCVLPCRVCGLWVVIDIKFLVNVVPEPFALDSLQLLEWWHWNDVAEVLLPLLAFVPLELLELFVFRLHTEVMSFSESNVFF